MESFVLLVSLALLFPTQSVHPVRVKTSDKKNQRSLEQLGREIDNRERLVRKAIDVEAKTRSPQHEIPLMNPLLFPKEIILLSCHISCISKTLSSTLRLLNAPKLSNPLLSADQISLPLELELQHPQDQYANEAIP